MPFTVRDTIGDRPTEIETRLPAPTAAIDCTLTTPVGVTQDRRGNVWIADTGDSRVLVADAGLDRLLAVIGEHGSGPGAFELPFRFAHHPTARALFVTDLGNERVQRLSYDYDDGVPSVTDVRVFRPNDDSSFHPNGIATYAYDDGLRVFVADEFYHEGQDLRGRIVVFDDEGAVCETFRSITTDHSGVVPLYWPQGLDVDADGHLLVANTGEGVLHHDGEFPSYFASVARCDRSGRGVPFESTGTPLLPNTFVTPRGVSALGAGADERIAVPDVGGGFVRLFDTEPGHTSEVPSSIAPRLDGRRFGSPMEVAPYEAPDRREADDRTARVLLSEALDHTVGAYDLGTISESKAELASLGAERDAPGQFDFPAGVAGLPTIGGERLLVVDSNNARLQVTDADGAGPLTPVALSHCRFPIGAGVWPVEPGRGYLFVADYSPSYDADNDDPQIAVYDLDCRGEEVRIEHVTSVGTWGIWGNNCKFPWGLDVTEIDADRARLVTTDSLNGRIQWWTFDRTTGELTYDDDAGRFGHDAGEFWNPSDVAVGERATYVADRNNNRLQSFDGDRWGVHGRGGYGTDGDRLLLPQSVAAAGGYVFVVDLVNRAIKVYAETSRDGRPALDFVDAMAAFGGDREAGDLWMPYMLHATTGDDADRRSAGRSGGDEPRGGVELVVPDAVLNVVYRTHWTPPV